MDPREEQRIQELLLEPESEGNVVVGSDSEEEDILEVSDHDTDSEQSASEVPVEEDEVMLQRIPIFDINRRSTNFILGKDGITEWYSCRPPRPINVRRRPHNILRMHLPGPRGNARTANTVDACWNLFFSENMLQTIVHCTNAKIEINRQKYQRERDAKDTDIIEIQSVIGLLYMAGSLRSSHENLEDLYATDFTGVDFFRCTMALRRLRFLLGSLRFDDATTREHRRQVDKLAPIRQVFEEFNNNCIANYTVGENCTIDEMLEPFRGRCPFRQYIKSKPAKYGLKIYALGDSKTFFTNKMEVYCGRQQQGPYNVSNSAKDVVLRLVQPISQSGRNVTVDNYFCSIPLCNELVRDHKLSLVGTVRRNKRELPEIVTQHTNRPLYSSLFFYGEEKTLLSYKSKNNKVVLLLSSLHDSDNIVIDSGDAMKPEILTFYNKNKGGVDTIDKLKATYNVGRKTNRWPLSLFYALLNIGGVNANIIYLANTGESIARKTFLKNLARELCMGQIRRRVLQENLPRHLKLHIKKLAGIEEERRPRVQGAVGRCAYCTWRENRKTTVTCSSCARYICKRHTVSYCQECAEDQNEENNEDEV